MVIENKQSYDKIFESDRYDYITLIESDKKTKKSQFDQDSEKRDEISDMLKNGNLK